MFHLRKLHSLRRLSKARNNYYGNCCSFKSILDRKKNYCNGNIELPGTTVLFGRFYSSGNEESALVVDPIIFERACEETLESLTEYFEELVESAPHLKEADVSYSSGVLTIAFGSPYGTYVINKQSPNRQIWLSSPTSGPKRYDLVNDDDCWVYKHTGEALHLLLKNEISTIVKQEVDFKKCSFNR